MATMLRCPKPECRQKFPWDTAKGFPRFCAICGADIAASDDNVVSMPAFLTKHSKVPDKVARDYMNGSEKRVELAAAMSGGSPSDFSELKVTDLGDRNDTLVSAQPVSNHITKFMDANPGIGGMQSNGAEYSTNVQRAYDPKGRDVNVGAKTMTALNNLWAKGGSPRVDRPALETQQPGYRRRG